MVYHYGQPSFAYGNKSKDFIQENDFVATCETAEFPGWLGALSLVWCVLINPLQCERPSKLEEGGAASRGEGQGCAAELEGLCTGHQI